MINDCCTIENINVNIQGQLDSLEKKSMLKQKKYT